MERDALIKLQDCIKGRLYKFNARNFSVGVFDGKNQFLGIRTKFGSRFIDGEYHWDSDPTHGTVWNIQDTGIDCPAEIPLLERLPGTVDRESGRPMAFDKSVNEGGTGRGWCFTDTDEVADIKIARPCAIANEALFEWLEKYQNL